MNLLYSSRFPKATDMPAVPVLVLVVAALRRLRLALDNGDAGGNLLNGSFD